MKRKATLLFLLLLFSVIQLVSAQKAISKSDSLLIELRKALKLDDFGKMIPVAEFLPDCWKNDSLSNNLLVREEQADGEEVTGILIAITYTKNGALFDTVKMMFDEFIDFYIKESVPLLKNDNNFYSCERDGLYLDFFANQCRILGSFEQTLVSLFIAQNNFPPEEIYRYDINRLVNYRRYTRRIQKLDTVHFMSSKYEAIIAQRLIYKYQGQRVDHLAPYHKELESVYLQHLASFDLTDKAKGTPEFKEENFKIQIIISRLSRISQTTANPEIGKAIVALFEKNIDVIHITPLYKAFQKIKGSDESAMLFLNNIFDHLAIQKYVPDERDYLFRSMWSESRKDLMKQTLLKRLNENNDKKRMLALYFLRFFPDEEVIEACLDIYRSKKKGIGERDSAKSNLSGFLQAPNLTEAQKNRIRRYINQ